MHQKRLLLPRDAPSLLLRVTLSSTPLATCTLDFFVHTVHSHFMREQLWQGLRGFDPYFVRVAAHEISHEAWKVSRASDSTHPANTELWYQHIPCR